MPTLRLPAMATAASSVMNSATPISTDRWDGPAPPELCEDSLIVLLSILLLSEEAGGLHQILVPLFFVRDPAEIFFPGHEALIEGAVAHQLLPLIGLAHLLEQVDVVVHLVGSHARRHEEAAQHQVLDIDARRLAGRNAVPGKVAGDLVLVV